MSGVRVVFDGYWLVDGPPSGRNVEHSTIATWARTHPEDDLVVAVPVPDGERAPLVDGLPVTRRFVAPGPLRNHQVWVRTRLGRAAADVRADVVVSQHFTPTGAARAVRGAFAYDAIFRDHPEWFTRAENLYLRAGFADTMRRADFVFTECETELARLERLYPAARGKVVTTGLGVPLGVASAAAAPVDTVGGRPFILSVGRLNVRKNLARLIAAYRSSPLLTAAFDLAVVGESNGRAAELDSNGPGTVRLLGGVDDAQLRWLYERAALFVMPSLDEGFGLPVLEAKTFGVPTAASDIAVFRELALADAYFDPMRVESIRGCLERLLDGAPAPASAPADLERFTWERLVETTRAALTGAGASTAEPTAVTAPADLGVTA